MLRFGMYQYSKYALLRGSEENTSSYIFGRGMNIPRLQNMSGF